MCQLAGRMLSRGGQSVLSHMKNKLVGESYDEEI